MFVLVTLAPYANSSLACAKRFFRRNFGPVYDKGAGPRIPELKRPPRVNTIGYVRAFVSVLGRLSLFPMRED